MTRAPEEEVGPPLARLRVEEERLRLARDLHDLLGQTFSIIALKSELAKQLIQEDPLRCEQEITEMEQVARQTLHQVREAVAGYRQPRLAVELEAVCQLLEAAGIVTQMTSLDENLPPAIDAVLAWTVRESVTNVIRHSHAKRCRITLARTDEMVCAEVINDEGRREQEEPGEEHPGIGLAGQRERVSALGGRMEAGPLFLASGEHFRVWVTLPLSGLARGQ
jgi:two-component system sensor histidine kinase DesK